VGGEERWMAVKVKTVECEGMAEEPRVQGDRDVFDVIGDTLAMTSDWGSC
jgi:hypothetical protein